MTPADIIAITEKHLGRKLTESEAGVALAQTARLGLIPRLPKWDVMAPRRPKAPAPTDTKRKLVFVAETSVPQRFIVLTRHIAGRPMGWPRARK
jgi:hypothetical protein